MAVPKQSLGVPMESHLLHDARGAAMGLLYTWYRIRDCYIPGMGYGIWDCYGSAT